MKKKWIDAVITEISVAIYVPKNAGKSIHKNRPFHGFVLNDECAVRDYYFDDGRVLHTYENSLFYLPKGSSYYVKSIREGSCYAINFDSAVIDEPFCINFKNYEELHKRFKRACNEWKRQEPYRQTSAMGAIYEAIYQLQRQESAEYASRSNREIIGSAIDEIEKNFCRRELSVEYLSSLCGISEVYFRKIFARSYGVTPKEYISRKRMEYAKQILRSRQFEVSEVARLCGYSEPCHFSREFKRRVGVAPKEYT